MAYTSTLAQVTTTYHIEVTFRRRVISGSNAEVGCRDVLRLGQVDGIDAIAPAEVGADVGELSWIIFMAGAICW